MKYFSSPIWIHDDPKHEKIDYHYGTFGWYSPRGFHIYFENSFAGNLQLIDKLRHYKWFGRPTRVMFIDFSVYNTQVNLFTTIK